MRDDFPKNTKEILAKRVGYRCSNPNCRKMTIGPNTENDKATNVGVAAHIKAAAEGGKRYDVSQSSEDRCAIENGIWLCQTCSKLIDSDDKYTVDLLLKWKILSENAAALDVENPPESKSPNVYITAINPVASQVAHTIVNNAPLQRTIAPIRDVLINKIKLNPLDYQIHLSTGDHEMESLAQEIDTAFKEAGWKQTGFIYSLASFYPAGITIAVSQADEINLFILNTFYQGGLKTKGETMVVAKELRIYIGPNK